MARKPRCIPKNSLVEITCRTVGGLFLLQPSDELNEVISGVLARYGRIHGMAVVYWVCLSNHMHGLLFVRDGSHLARFMRDVNREIAKEIGRIRGWDRKLWHRRYDAAPVADDEASVIDRLTYCISQGVKENLVSQVSQWPGIHTANNIAAREPLRGVWRDRTLEYRSQRRGKTLDSTSFLHEEVLELAKPPCWRHLSDEEYAERIVDIVQQIEHRAALERGVEGLSCLGREQVLCRDPLDSSASPKRSPKPLFHAASKRVRMAMRDSFKTFYDAFYVASALFRSGDLSAVFPDGSFPPALPFQSGIREGPTRI